MALPIYIDLSRLTFQAQSYDIFFIPPNFSMKSFVVSELFLTFADASAITATISSEDDGADGQSTTLWKSDTVRYVFDCLNLGNSTLVQRQMQK